jgi:predicted N-acetyltransferase YhbS
LLLGPLAVHPGRQNLGIGLTLMETGLQKAAKMGGRLVILVGDAPYYARVGFKVLPEGQLKLPGPVDPQRFLYHELVPGALAEASGVVLAPWRVQRPSRYHMAESASSKAPSARSVA